MNTKTFSLIHLEQGTEDWHAWRRKGIGASDAPTIMGENPWKKRNELMSEKRTGHIVPQTHVMRRGHRLEPEARKEYETALRRQVTPQCLQSVKHAWLLASVDGISADHSTVVEIKCGKGAYSYSRSKGKAPQYYYAQLQHILAVTNLDVIDYWSYQPKCPSIHIVVERDLAYIERMLHEEFEFWNEFLKTSPDDIAAAQVMLKI